MNKSILAILLYCLVHPALAQRTVSVDPTVHPSGSSQAVSGWVEPAPASIAVAPASRPVGAAPRNRPDATPTITPPSSFPLDACGREAHHPFRTR